jgi:hypothetical protein
VKTPDLTSKGDANRSCWFYTSICHAQLYELFLLNRYSSICRVRWVPCHHGMARPQVADGGSPPGTEGSCECIE